jgi:imidazoleglycerol-phosphate dehydratase/histidinol-phosphatase
VIKRLFVDRDGTLIEEPEDEQIDRIDKVRLVPGVIDALSRLSRAGYRLIIVTNQDGLGTASFPQEEFDRPHRFMLDLFASQGVQFDDVVICPHFPGDGCTCRKPHLGLVRPFLDRELDTTHSAVVGDRQTDVELADNMGLRGFRLGPELTWQQVADALLDAPRTAQVVRETGETQIRVEVNLDGDGRRAINTGIPFLDHMLEQVAAHSGLDLTVHARGDLDVDAHHTVEDTALTIGQALRRAAGDKVGIGRYGFVLPMDESQARVALDLSGRALLRMDCTLPPGSVGGLPLSLVPHFFRSLSDALGATLHIAVDGEDAHHMVEATFKAFARCLRQAFARNQAGLPSTKGTL